MEVGRQRVITERGYIHHVGLLLVDGLSQINKTKKGLWNLVVHAIVQDVHFNKMQLLEVKL